MNKKMLLLVVFLIGGLGLFWMQNMDQNDVEPKEIVFGYRPISPSLDFFVAIDKGYFEEKGLKVKLEVFRGSSDLTDAVMTGKVDFASDLGMVTQLLPMMRTGKQNLFFLSLALDALDSEMRGPTLVAKKDIGISSVKDLAGKTIGIFPGINFKIFLEAVLSEYGLNVEKDVKVVQIPPQEQMTAFPSVDALLSLDPITSGIQARYGAIALDDRLSARYIFDNFPASASSVNKDFANRHPEVVAKVIESLGQGIDFVRSHPAETAPILSKWTKLPETITSRMKPVKYAKFNEIDINGLQKACDYLKSVPWLDLKHNIDAKNLVWRN